MLNKDKGRCLTLGKVVKEVNKINSVNVNSNMSFKERKHKVVILGDSHLRVSVMSIKDHLNNNFEVTGFTKLGSGVGQTMHKSVMEYTTLTENDVIVFNGGSNDVNVKNLKLALVQITKFIQVNNNTKIIVLGIPHRHDCHEHENSNI
jgi:methyl coenzyme M reductase subunit C-like uncharacterized protein (methanogenesis marker protein 7)